MVPEALRGQVKMVHGLEVDARGWRLESQTHWVKASVSHGAAVAHAALRLRVGGGARGGHDVRAGAYAWREGNFQDLNRFLETETQDDPQWHAIRLGYRAVDHESNSMVRCAAECTCEAAGSALCYLRDPQCQLHASDGYILRDTMYDYMLGMVSAGGVIDFGVLQGVPKQIVLTPQHVPDGVRRRSGHTDLQTQLATTACVLRRLHEAGGAGEGEGGGGGSPGRAIGARRAGRARARVEGNDHAGDGAARAWEQGNTQPFRAATLGSEAEDVSRDHFFVASRGERRCSARRASARY